MNTVHSINHSFVCVFTEVKAQRVDRSELQLTVSSTRQFLWTTKLLSTSSASPEPCICILYLCRQLGPSPGIFFTNRWTLILAQYYYFVIIVGFKHLTTNNLIVLIFRNGYKPWNLTVLIHSLKKYPKCSYPQSRNSEVCIWRSSMLAIYQSNICLMHIA